jgi:hypothetical protein
MTSTPEQVALHTTRFLGSCRCSAPGSSARRCALPWRRCRSGTRSAGGRRSLGNGRVWTEPRGATALVWRPLPGAEDRQALLPDAH